MSYKVKNKELGEALRKAETAEGFLIMISHLNDGKLNHFWTTNKFPREDFIPSLESHRRLLRGEMPPTTIKKIEVPEKERQLPPEYRPENLGKKGLEVKARMKI